MKTLKIKSEYGIITITTKKEGGLTFDIPIGMNGRAYDDFLFYNEIEIKAFRNKNKKR